MGFDLGGEYVRFYVAGEEATAIALPLFTMSGGARTLADGEWFYLTDLYWAAPNQNLAYILFDDHNDDGSVDDGETVAYINDAGLAGGHTFNVPSPLSNPKLISVNDTSDFFVGGSGIIRSV